VFDHAEFAHLAPDEPGQGLIGVLNSGAGSLGGVVAADGCLQLEVADDGVEDRLRGTPLRRCRGAAPAGTRALLVGRRVPRRWPQELLLSRGSCNV
jgi:hypothetical protein